MSYVLHLVFHIRNGWAGDPATESPFFLEGVPFNDALATARAYSHKYNLYWPEPMDPRTHAQTDFAIHPLQATRSKPKWWPFDYTTYPTARLQMSVFYSDMEALWIRPFFQQPVFNEMLQSVLEWAPDLPEASSLLLPALPAQEQIPAPPPPTPAPTWQPDPLYGGRL